MLTFCNDEGFENLENKFAVGRIGLIFSDDELGEMVAEADIDGDQHVSFEEFRDIFNEG